MVILLSSKQFENIDGDNANDYDIKKIVLIFI